MKLFPKTNTFSILGNPPSKNTLDLINHSPLIAYSFFWSLDFLQAPELFLHPTRPNANAKRILAHWAWVTLFQI